MTKTEEATKQAGLQLQANEATFYLLGETPLIMNRMSEKAKRQLLLPKSRKRVADRGGELKHVPIDEYRASVHAKNVPVDGEPMLFMPTPCVKGAIATASLDYPGTRKTEIERLVFLPETSVPIWGIPQLHMGIVRSADINKTPDVRTRAIIPQWATRVRVRWMRPLVEDFVIQDLIGLAGITNGIGDFRQQKGKGSFGCWTLTGPNDTDKARWETWQALTQITHEDQAAAIESPEFYDEQTAELFDWFVEETANRAAAVELAATPKTKGKKANGMAEAAIQ